MQETTKVLLNWSVLRRLLIDTPGAIRKHGIRFPLVATNWLYYKVLNVWHESRFDRRFGVRTGFIVAANDLSFDDLKVQRQAVRYRPTPPFTIIQGLKKLERLSGMDFSKESFVDYGCGAGRVIIIAAQSGFGNVTGLELSPPLIETCRANIAQYASVNPTSNLTVLKKNAALYEPPTNATVFFFFVPFGAEVYKDVMTRITESVAKRPRTIYIVEIGSELRSFDFEEHGCRLIGTVEKLSILQFPSS